MQIYCRRIVCCCNGYFPKTILKNSSTSSAYKFSLNVHPLHNKTYMLRTFLTESIIRVDEAPQDIYFHCYMHSTVTKIIRSFKSIKRSCKFEEVKRTLLFLHPKVPDLFRFLRSNGHHNRRS